MTIFIFLSFLSFLLIPLSSLVSYSPFSHYSNIYSRFKRKEFDGFVSSSLPLFFCPLLTLVSSLLPFSFLLRSNPLRTSKPSFHFFRSPFFVLPSFHAKSLISCSYSIILSSFSLFLPSPCYLFPCISCVLPVILFLHFLLPYTFLFFFPHIQKLLYLFLSIPSFPLLFSIPSFPQSVILFFLPSFFPSMRFSLPPSHHVFLSSFLHVSHTSSLFVPFASRIFLLLCV